jgi:hypothetical protein
MIAIYGKVKVSGTRYRVTEGGGIYDGNGQHYGWINLFPYYDGLRTRRELTREVRNMVTA